VTVTVPRRPEYLNSCNCTLCTKLGSLTGYFHPDEVTVTGETRQFVRSDIEACLAVPFCPTCGASTGWISLTPFERRGVNMRLFDPSELVGVPVRFPEGRDDERFGEPRRPEMPFSLDGAF
jgi:hypothetical protein